MRIQTVNPDTGLVLKDYPLLTQADIEQKISCAVAEFNIWRKTSFKDRQAFMLAMAACLNSGIEKFANLIASEMGKPLESGRQEIKKCAWVCQHYAEHAESYLTPELIQTDFIKSFVCYQPLGVIFAIMPWNFPFWQVFRFAAPNLMAGNVVLLRHALITTGCGHAIEELFLEAGFPNGTFQHLIIDHEMAACVIAHQDIAGVTLTGSEHAGSLVGANAGSHLKKTVLELGGNDAYIVLADADLDKAAKAIVMSRLNNSGQTCISAKRVIAVADVMPLLLEKIIELTAMYVVGNPLDPNTKIGPMARADLRETLHRQVMISIAKGAELVMGGVMPATPGFYYPITLLTKVKPGMPAFDDELFGPVFAMVTAQDEAQAIALANQSRFGLGSAIFTRDLQRGESLARDEIEAGTCYVNEFVSSDPRLPIGGIKHSGYGRELAKQGLLEFMNVKTVAIHA